MSTTQPSTIRDDHNYHHDNDMGDIDTIIQKFCIQQRYLLDVEYNNHHHQYIGTVPQPEAVMESSFSTENPNQYSNTNTMNKDSITTTTTTTTTAAAAAAAAVLNHLMIEDLSIGLYGRTVIRLVRDDDNTTTTTTTITSNTTTTMNVSLESTVTAAAATTAAAAVHQRQRLLLPAHKLTTGDEIELRSTKSSSASSSSASSLVSLRSTDDGSRSDPTYQKSHSRNIMNGVVCEVTDTSISIAISSSSSSSSSLTANTSSQQKSSSTSSNKKNHPHHKKEKDHIELLDNDDNDDDIWNDTSVRFTIVPKSQRIIYEKLIYALQLLQQKKYYTMNHSTIVHAMFQPPPPVAVAAVAAVVVSHSKSTSAHHLNNNNNTTITLQPPPQQQQHDGDDDMTERDIPTPATTSQAIPSSSLSVTPASQHYDHHHHHYQNPNLDSSQKEAIHFALSSSSSTTSSPHHSQIPITLIHGPPGTGKTTTLVELIYQAIVHYNYKNILVTAPSNVAVDNILSRLVQMNHRTKNMTNRSGRSKKLSSNQNGSTTMTHSRPLRMVRIGHPARIQSDIQSYSLDALVQNADGTEIVQQVRKELQSHIHSLQQQQSSTNGSKRNNHHHATASIHRRLIYQEMKTLRKEIRVREEKIVQELMDQAHVVCTTCVGAATLLHPKSNPRDRKSRPTKTTTNDSDGTNDPVQTSTAPIRSFDIVIIDEAAQAIEASCWIPILLASTKVILAGDHLQLPPTITTDHPTVQKSLQYTMFERLMHLYHHPKASLNASPKQHPISRMLQVQYRMNERIANWASQALYNHALQTHVSVRHHTLSDLVVVPKSTKDENHNNINSNDIVLDDTILQMPLLYIDTADCDLYESTNSSGSRYNLGEAQIVVAQVQHLLSLGILPEQMAVITPYNGQVELLKSMLLTTEITSTVPVRSVDGFQGGEREAVIISLVRSSPRGGSAGIGFLNDDRRLNVAITRAKRYCCVIGDSTTVRQSPLIRNFIKWVEKYGEHRSAYEVMSDTGDDAPNASDLVEAERMMQQLMDSIETRNDSTTKSKEKSVKTVIDPLDVERRHQNLLEKIQMFLSQKKAGDEMILASELTRLDRKLVHEIAEKFGLEHVSEGVDGVNRRITIRIPIPPASINPTNEIPINQCLEHSTVATNTTIDTATVDVVDRDLTDNLVPNELAVEINNDNTIDASDSVDVIPTNDNNEVTDQQHVGLNSVLGSLARERAERERLRHETQANDKKKKNKGKKLGGARPVLHSTTPALTTTAVAAAVDDNDDDDMAFLDAQIDAVQNSHGRHVIGSGKEYRSIINGVLIAKPIPKSTVNTNKSVKSSALNAKIKAAQESRKSQAKKK